MKTVRSQKRRRCNAMRLLLLLTFLNGLSARASKIDKKNKSPKADSTTRVQVWYVCTYGEPSKKQERMTSGPSMPGANYRLRFCCKVRAKRVVPICRTLTCKKNVVDNFGPNMTKPRIR